MNLANKTQSNIRISIKGNFPIETSGYSRFIGLVENLNPKDNKYFKNGY